MSDSARLTATISGWSMCSSGGERLRSAVTRSSLEPPMAPRITAAFGEDAGRSCTWAPGGCQSASSRAALRGMVTNTLPLLWPSETHMSGAYSTERSSTSKYSGSRAATAAPRKAPSGATIARPNTIV
jgi:hypothetical protein